MKNAHAGLQGHVGTSFGDDGDDYLGGHGLVCDNVFFLNFLHGSDKRHIYFLGDSNASREESA
jgi:hypothetical protein